VSFAISSDTAQHRSVQVRPCEVVNCARTGPCLGSHVWSEGLFLTQRGCCSLPRPPTWRRRQPTASSALPSAASRTTLLRQHTDRAKAACSPGPADGWGGLRRGRGGQERRWGWEEGSQKGPQVGPSLGVQAPQSGISWRGYDIFA